MDLEESTDEFCWSKLSKMDLESLDLEVSLFSCTPPKMDFVESEVELWLSEVPPPKIEPKTLPCGPEPKLDGFTPKGGVADAGLPMPERFNYLAR